MTISPIAKFFYSTKSSNYVRTQKHVDEKSSKTKNNNKSMLSILSFSFAYWKDVFVSENKQSGNKILQNMKTYK